MYTYEKCLGKNLFVICRSSKNSPYFVPLGSLFLSMMFGNEYGNEIAEKSNEANITILDGMIRIYHYNYNGIFLVTEKEAFANQFCEYLNSLEILDKLKSY